MKIRKASKADVPALQTLLRNSWLTTWAPELAFATVQRFAAEDPAGHYASDKWRDFAVADEAGAVLGMFHVEDDHLHALHLDPRRKRRRIGSVLMDAIERNIAAGYKQASLEVRAFNKGAIAFYGQRGWTVRRSYAADECGESVETLEMIKALDAR